jgi:uracil-DNA glycosylase
MNWEKFKDQFHESWHLKMKPFIESEACDNIYKFLKSESQRGKKIAPLSSNVYRCFKETSLDELKVVIVGMAPYHTLKQGSPVADGLLMGCSTTGVLQPSLEQFYNAIEREVYNGLCLHCEKPADVSYLAHQGVLMFNASLTTEINKAGSHLEIWEPFTKYVLEEIISPTMVPIVFLGKDAAKYARYTSPFAYSFVTTHPASASYKNTEWESGDVFRMVNKVIKDNNNFQIEWLDGTPF